MNVAPRYQPILREIGLDADAVFTHPDIRVWRKLPDRENCTLDAALTDGRSIRLHIKRYPPQPSPQTPADLESAGIRLLQSHNIPTVPLVAWGNLPNHASFLITEDLAGYDAADKFLEQGIDVERLLNPIADLAADLHNANLHHRDLYLCHFFVKLDSESADLRLIDPARVKTLPRFLFRRRWIVKDLAQLWYSTTKHPQITDAHRDALLSRYLTRRNLPSTAPSLKRSIQSKSNQIARHDARLNARQPSRNISIPK